MTTSTRVAESYMSMARRESNRGRRVGRADDFSCGDLARFNRVALHEVSRANHQLEHFDSAELPPTEESGPPSVNRHPLALISSEGVQL